MRQVPVEGNKDLLRFKSVVNVAMLPGAWKFAQRSELPSTEEDAATTAATMSDADALPCTDAEWEAAKPTMRVGRPISKNPKVHQGLRFDADILAFFKAGGKGWQTRINAALREWVTAHQG